MLSIEKVKEVILAYDLEVKKQILNYGLADIHGRMCDDINIIRSELFKQLDETASQFKAEQPVEDETPNSSLAEFKNYVAQKYGYSSWIGTENAMITHISNEKLINERMDEAIALYEEHISKVEPVEDEKYKIDLINELINIYEHPEDSNKEWKGAIVDVAREKGFGNETKETYEDLIRIYKANYLKADNKEGEDELWNEVEDTNPKVGDKVIVMQELHTTIEKIEGDKYWFKDEDGKLWNETIDVIEFEQSIKTKKL